MGRGRDGTRGRTSVSRGGICGKADIGGGIYGTPHNPLILLSCILHYTRSVYA